MVYSINNMKSFFRISILVCCMSAIFLGCNDKNISESLEIIKASQISAISAQMTSIRTSVSKLETVDSELNDLISSIRDGMEVEDGNDYGMEKVIQKLERTDVTLKQRIVDLKEYCDSPENQTSGWTATTYLTLEKHNAVLTEIADLNNTLVSELLTVIGDVDSSCSKKIAAERAKLQADIKDLEISLKDWVSDQLSGYYTIAEVEAKLKACEEGYKAGDEALETELATLRQALETAKTELTSAYQDAIAAAISENNGTIDQKIASDIKAATDTLQEQIGSLSTRLDALESRVTDLEATVAKIISMVQSVVVVPDYSDGSVAISRVEDNKVRFEVYPLSAAESIAKIGTSILSFDYVETITKSSEEFIQLPITAVKCTGKTLLLTVDGSNLPESVLDAGIISANARLKISDGISTRSSEYFPIYKKESGTNPENGVAITCESSDISESSAKLFGLCNQSGVEGASVVYGIEFSSTDLTTNAMTLKASEKDADNKYYCVADNLSSNTLYYYRAFTFFNGVMTYGEVKSFTTLDFPAIEFQTGSIFISNDVESGICNLIILEQGLSIDETSDEEISGTGNIAYFILASNGGGEDELAAGTYLSNNSTIKAESMIFTSPEEFAKMSGKAITDATLTVSRDTKGEEIYYSGSFEFFADEKKFSGSFKDLVNSVMSKETPPPPPTLVDLGLSVLWASCNLGASKPTEYGGYYQWAGTKDVSDTDIYLDWSNCPYHTGSSNSSGWSKYNTKSSYGTVDNKTVLEAMDDAATVALGGNWRIPTDEEWTELMNTDNCSWTWTSIDGVSGYNVQSKKSGYTDKWIFLPAAGYRNNDRLSDVGSRSYYWSSSLHTDYPSVAYDMYFNSSYVSRFYDFRYYGQPVRPVSEY